MRKLVTFTGLLRQSITKQIIKGIAMNDILKEAEQELKHLKGLKVQARKMRKAQKKKRQNLEQLLSLHYDTLTAEQRTRIRTILMIRQNGLCAICSGEPNKKELAIDHDHSNGHIRGLLCTHCNFMLGFARDSIASLSAAIQYIEDDRQKQFV